MSFNRVGRYCFVALSRKAATLVFSLERSASCKYIMWPAS